MYLSRALTLAALLTSAAASTATESNPLTIKEASVGFGGKFKAGFWQPVHLHLIAGPTGAKGHLRLVVPDGDQVPVAYSDANQVALDVAPGNELEITLYAKSGPVAAPFIIELRQDGALVWSQQLPSIPHTLRSTQEFIVSLGPRLGVEDAIQSLRRRSDSAAVAVSLTSAKRLPDRWWAYDGVDVVVLATSDAAFFAEMSSEQRQALIQWVQLGGRMVLSVGSRGAEIAAASSPWSVLIPGVFQDVEPLRDRAGLENYTKAELPFNDPLFQRNRPIVTRLKNIRGEVLVDELGASTARPLVVRSAVGLGLVAFVGLDFDHPSLQNWKGRSRLLAALIARADGEGEHAEREAHRGVTHLGYDDLIGQLNSALDRFAGVAAVSFTAVTMMIIGYLLLIGPGDYLLLSRLGLPRHLTWITFPLVALAATVASAIVHRQSHGSLPRLNQVEIIDVDLAAQVARGTVWSHVYSPTTRTYSAGLEVAVPPDMLAAPVQGWLTWQGLPGDSLGGLESNPPPLVQREPYSVALPGPEPRIDGLTIQVASAKSLAGGWWSTTKMPSTSKLTIDRYGLLAGEFTQPLNVSLADCLLAHGEKLYRLGTLGYQQRVQLADFPPLNLEARLTQRRVELSKDVATPWERDSVDIPRIVQMLMFHEAARGQNYTGLTHGYQPRLDLSEHIRLGQVVLVGRAEKPVARLVAPNSTTSLVHPDQSSTYTWFRIIFPVN